MDQRISKPEWLAFATTNYRIIMHEIEQTNPKELAQQYPKFVVMYEYFRLLRGEGFLDQRSFEDTGEHVGMQSALYDMENKIALALQTIRERLDFSDSTTKHYINEMKKHFDL